MVRGFSGRSEEGEGLHDYGTFSFESKAQVLEQAKKYWNPDKTQFWTDAGVDLVIDRREGYFLWDMDGRRLIDMHLNGGTYNLGPPQPRGHGRPQSTACSTSTSATTTSRRWRAPRWRSGWSSRRPASIDQGRLRLRWRRGHRHRAQERPARHPAPQDRLDRQGLPRPHRPGGRPPATTGSPSCSSPTGPTSSSRCPSATSTRWSRRLRGGDVAAVIMETIPATYGFPLPPAGYLEAVKDADRDATTRSTSPTRCRPA